MVTQTSIWEKKGYYDRYFFVHTEVTWERQFPVPGFTSPVVIVSIEWRDRVVIKNRFQVGFPFDIEWDGRHYRQAMSLAEAVLATKLELESTLSQVLDLIPGFAD